MDTPPNLTLPFFSYGLFQPRQIGFKDLRTYVQSCDEHWSIAGCLLGRDGLPVLMEGTERVSGTVIHFRSGDEEKSYRIIIKIEPDELYRWDTAEAQNGPECQKVNVFAGLKVKRGTHPLETETWNGREEPLFSTALEVITKTLNKNRKFNWNLKPLFGLQMAYLLLWSAIERFASFKYHLGDKAVEKVFRIADEPEFVKALQELVTEPRTVYRSDKPENKVTLDPNIPKKGLAYYYQVRSNITHRGKAAYGDHDTLVKSLEELLEIFNRIKKAEFDSE